MTLDKKLSHAIGSAKNANDLLRALGEYYHAADFDANECAASDTRSLACREGCAFCCYIPVGACAQEVLLVAAFIQSRFTTTQQASLVEKLRKHVDVISPLTMLKQQTTNIPCPLLNGSCCSVYSVRPLACRAYHSLNVSSCQYSFDHPEDTHEKRPTISELESAWMTMTSLANEAFAEHGYDRTFYELGSALLEALTNAATSRRFHRRTKAFPQAKQLKV